MDTTPVGTLGSCEDCPCGTTGHKSIVARKVWHGRWPFNAEICSLHPEINTAPDRTKYLTKEIDVRLRASASVSYTHYVYDNNDECSNPQQITENGTSEIEDYRLGRISVGKNSGVITLSDCDCHRTTNYSSETLRPALPLFDILCTSAGISRYLPWVDIMVSLNACNGVIFSEIGQVGCVVTFPSGTPSEIEAALFIDTPDFQQSAHVELSATEIHVVVEQSYSYTDSGTDTCGKPYDSNGSGSGTIEATVSLVDPYHDTEVNSEVDSLLGQRSLSDNTYYAWHYGCSFPFVFRDEVETPSTPDSVSLVASVSADRQTLTSDPCTYEDPNATSGGYAGSGFTGNIINGSGPVTDWYWVPPGYLPWGAFKDFQAGVLTAAKYAQILKTRDAHNWFRPCGADDRALTDDCSNPRFDFSSGAGQNGWPICGRIAVIDATNASPIVIEVADTQGLQTGDIVDIDGVTGNDNANGTNWTITYIDSTHFSLDGSAGSGAYTSGGYVNSSGAPSYTWNDSSSKGDYLVIKYEWNIREVVIDPTIRQYLPNYGLAQSQSDITVVEGNLGFSGSPRVVSISPNGETWSNGTNYNFPAAASPLVLDERFGSLWAGQIRQRMLEPINRQFYVEARNSVPSGAPALPTISDPCCSIYSVTTPCPYVHIMTVAEVNALGASGTPTGLIEGPLFVCFAFDDD